ncbi:hypothetical protein A2642_04535 [Candidatus Nomurabacteria bacterium RIFCSPHIGHO2_01_FULL_39_10]|uniref:HEPN domain-containing protein n=1 Tax=Candidatus Nomurabacteria bacterium RIFCSPHIGHO2_01_FULL_39_10 TaxID=1801733 RepID=A0A1F6V7W1_9BACT|nr:MAG: hypothetical protein A2642_04535 [Candidatus Nomurabacteria bacterium RIFCSPHIGHO2_01_FULL_39_10]
MVKERTLHSVYDVCTAEGSFLPQAKIDVDLITTITTTAMNDFAAAKVLRTQAKPESTHWNSIFKLHYDVFHQLAEALVYFDSMKVKTHECLFVYLCQKYPELEFSWEFLEQLRIKRNRSIYYGEPMKYVDWKSIEFQLQLYINALYKMIQERISAKGY